MTLDPSFWDILRVVSTVSPVAQVVSLSSISRDTNLESPRAPHSIPRSRSRSRTVPQHLGSAGNAGNADAQCDASCMVSLNFQESQVSFSKGYTIHNWFFQSIIFFSNPELSFSIFIMFWCFLYFFVSWLKVDVLQMVSWQAFPCPGRGWCFFTIKVATASDFLRSSMPIAQFFLQNAQALGPWEPIFIIFSITNWPFKPARSLA